MGNYSVRLKAPTTAIDPDTGEEYTIPPQPGDTELVEMTAEEEAAHLDMQEDAQAAVAARDAARETAAQQRAADLAVLAGDDPAKQAALSRLLGA